MNFSQGNRDTECFDAFQSNNFLENDFENSYNELNDCYLSSDALDIFLAPLIETWKDFLSNNDAVITVDSSRMKQWELGKKK